MGLVPLNGSGFCKAKMRGLKKLCQPHRYRHISRDSQLPRHHTCHRVQLSSEKFAKVLLADLKGTVRWPILGCDPSISQDDHPLCTTIKLQRALKALAFQTS